MDIQKFYHIKDATAGFLQTVFICAYMIFAPVFGYLGDRYSRKTIMLVGIFIWVGAVLLSTFVGPNVTFVICFQNLTKFNFYSIFSISGFSCLVAALLESEKRRTAL